MAWPNPFLQKNDDTRSAWGYTFQLSSDHLTLEQMKPMKYSYDVLGELALDRLNHLAPPPRSASPRIIAREGSRRIATDVKQHPPPSRDLYMLLREHAHEDDILGRLWSEVTTPPPWVDWDQIARGQDCFYRYGGPALVRLFRFKGVL